MKESKILAQIAPLRIFLLLHAVPPLPMFKRRCGRPAAPAISNSVHISCDILRRVFRLARNRQRKRDAVLRGEDAAPVEEILGFLGVAVLRQLVKIVDKNMRDIKVSRVQAADKAAQERITAVSVFLDVDKPNLVIDVEAQCIALLNADDAAGFALNCLIESTDEQLRLAGAFGTS